MSLDRRPRVVAGRRASLINASHYRAAARAPPVIWNLQGVRGQMSSNCLWHACRALFVGLLLFGVGTVMCISGFYADGVFDESSSNTTTTGHYSREKFLRDPARQVKFSKLSYIGPIVMGVGGFVIVATCVMTFEARDSAAKVGPAAFGTTSTSSSSHVYPLTNKCRREVRSVGSQTQGSSLSGSTLQLFDRKHLMEAFRKFSKTLRTSSSVTSMQGEQFHRSPSAPSLLNATLPVRRGSSSNTISSTRRFLQKTKPRIPPALRQAMSVDCPRIGPSTHNHHPFVSVRQNSSTQTLTLPQLPTPYLSRMNFSSPTTSHPKIQRSIYSTSSECNPCSTSDATLNEETESAKLRYENECSVLRTVVNASVHFDSESMTNDYADDLLSNGLLCNLNILKPNITGGSASSLRTLSPNPGYYSEDSMDISPVKSEQIRSSPILSQKAPRLRSAEFSYNRPSLSRQPKVDYPEITAIPDSDEDEVPPNIILPQPEEDLCTIPE